MYIHILIDVPLLSILVISLSTISKTTTAVEYSIQKPY